MKLLELMVKYDIKWPSGAYYAAQDKSAVIYWYSSQPVIDNEEWNGYNTSICFDSQDLSSDWSTRIVTLEEWQQEREKMQKQQDNSWHERGELPPVGCECEWVEFSKSDLNRGVSSGDVVEILAHYSPCSDDVSVAVFSYKVNSDGQRGRLVDQAVSACFRPLRTEREKAIDALVEIICAGGELSKDGSAAREIAERIYEAQQTKRKS